MENRCKRHGSAVTEIEPTRDRVGIGLALALIVMAGMFAWAALAVGGWPAVPFWIMGGIAALFGLLGLEQASLKAYRDDRTGQILPPQMDLNTRLQDKSHAAER